MMSMVQRHIIIINIKIMRNFVAKHLRKFCKATVEKDRKKEDKKGYVKHKAVLSEKNYGTRS
jgi:hypothetical protein